MTPEQRALMYGPSEEDEEEAKLKEWPLNKQMSILNGEDVEVHVQDKNYVRIRKGINTYLLTTSAYAVELEKQVKELQQQVKRLSAFGRQHQVAIRSMARAIVNIEVALKGKVDKF